MDKVKVEILTDAISGYKKGQVIDIEVDINRVPCEKFWRRRFKDAEVDNCLKILKPSTKKPKREKVS